MSAKAEAVSAMIELYRGGWYYADLYHCAQCSILAEAGLVDDKGRCPKCAAERGDMLDDQATERAGDLRREEEAGCRKP